MAYVHYVYSCMHNHIICPKSGQTAWQLPKNGFSQTPVSYRIQKHCMVKGCNTNPSDPCWALGLYCKARSSRITARNLSEAKLSYNFLHLRQSYIVEHVYNHSANSTHGLLFAEPEWENRSCSCAPLILPWPNKINCATCQHVHAIKPRASDRQRRSQASIIRYIAQLSAKYHDVNAAVIPLPIGYNTGCYIEAWLAINCSFEGVGGSFCSFRGLLRTFAMISKGDQ